MTLKEKIKKLNLSTWISSEDTKKLEKIAEDFAIDFGEWLDYTFQNNDLVFGSVETLFELYKKEKGL